MRRALGVAAVLACLGAPCAAEDAAPAGPPLRAAIAPYGRFIGSAAAYKPLQSDPGYASFLGEQFSMLTPENALKFEVVHPRRGDGAGSYDFTQGDAIVAFAATHDMKVRGHTLVWQNQVPDWVIQPFPSDAELAAILKGHVAAVVGHYRGKLYSWDVVNEAVFSDGSLRSTLWSSLGPDYAANAFRWARAADPSAKLFYNDYGAESDSAKADGIYAFVKDLKSRGAPIDGVGFQMHLDATKSYGDFAALLRRFADLGLEVQITELDVKNDGSAAQLQAQADLYAKALKACLDVPKCTAVVTWGFTDKYGWSGSHDGRMIDASGRARPAYGALEKVLAPR